jgi:hypothetical protein
VGRVATPLDGDRGAMPLDGDSGAKPLEMSGEALLDVEERS